MLTHQVVCPVMVGRQAELDALVALVERAAGERRGRTVFVTGDAGVGKSRLCRELKQHAVARGVRALEGRCTSADSSPPYGPFLDALRFRLAKGEADVAARVLGPVASHLAPLLPELRPPGAPAESARDALPAPSERVFEAVAKVFERLAELGPILLILEDFQFADSTSRELLRFIARRVQTLPVVIVATCRSDELPPRHPVRRLIAGLTGERLAREIALRPLDERGVADMLAAIVGSVPSPELIRVVYRRSEGNPFFVEELLHALADTPQFMPDAGDVERASPPATIHEMVLGRLEPLGAGVVNVLSVAAVIGRRFDFDILRQVTGRSEEELLTIVELLVDQQVLVEEPGSHGERYVFRHVLTQEVLYNHLLARRRRMLHRQVAATLEARAPDRVVAAALAYHHRAGGDAVHARKYAVLAGDQAARVFAWQDAESWYERALESLEGGTPDAPLEADVLEKLAYVSWWQGRADAALEYMEDALAIRRVDATPASRALLPTTLRHVGLLHAYHRGDWERGLALLKESLALVEPEPDHADVIRISNDLGRLLIGTRDFATARPWLERALALARDAGKPVEEAYALANLGLLAVLRGEIAAGLVQIEQARALVSATSVPIDRATGIHSAGIRALDAAHEHTRTREWIAQALQYSDRHGVPANRAVFDTCLAASALRTGEHCEQVLALAQRSVETLRSAKRVELRDALRVLGDVHRFRGDFPSARDAYAEAQRLGDQASEAGIALVLLASDRAASAADRLAALVARIPDDQHLVRIQYLAPAIEAAVAAQRFADTFEMIDALHHHAERTDVRVAGPVLEFALGLVASISGDVTAAMRHFELAADRWAALGEPLARARALGELARVMIAADRDSFRGAALGREAIRIAEAVGAGAEVDRYRRMLRRVGIRVRTRPPAPDALLTEDGAAPYGLTARELDVLAELVAGRTNKEIAASLGISEKTASIHVSHILAKLECATRTQAAAIAIDQGLVRRAAVAG